MIPREIHEAVTVDLGEINAVRRSIEGIRAQHIHALERLDRAATALKGVEYRLQQVETELAKEAEATRERNRMLDAKNLAREQKRQQRRKRGRK